MKLFSAILQWDWIIYWFERCSTLFLLPFTFSTLLLTSYRSLTSLKDYSSEKASKIYYWWSWNEWLSFLAIFLRMWESLSGSNFLKLGLKKMRISLFLSLLLKWYILSWRTKLLSWECLKYIGSIFVYRSRGLMILKHLPLLSHNRISLYS